jgi:hypothetical protein
MAAEITAKVESCTVCCDFMDKQSKEPLMSHSIPTLPWSKVGQDLFERYGESYLVTVDYYSDYFELDHLEGTKAATTAKVLIGHTKSYFARHGIADLVTDNGPQYTSQEFQDFATSWEFKHVTSSPYHSQSNGKAESAVKIAKKLVKKCKRDGSDLQMALLEWRNTPDVNGQSPVQKLMSRRTKTTMPTAEGLLKPQAAENVPENIKLKKQKAKVYYDKSAKPLPELEIGEGVRLQPQNKGTWTKGSCVKKVGARSYLVETDKGLYRRNRKFLRSTKEAQPDEEQYMATDFILDDMEAQVKSVEQTSDKPAVQTPRKTQTPTSSQPQCSKMDDPVYKTRSGRAIHTPKRYQ